MSLIIVKSTLIKDTKSGPISTNTYAGSDKFCSGHSVM